jgi:hypothetical protein
MCMSMMGNPRGLTACGEELLPAQPTRSVSNETETIAGFTPASLVVVVSHRHAPRLPPACWRPLRLDFDEPGENQSVSSKPNALVSQAIGGGVRVDPPRLDRVDRGGQRATRDDVNGHA